MPHNRSHQGGEGEGRLAAALRVRDLGLEYLEKRSAHGSTAQGAAPPGDRAGAQVSRVSAVASSERRSLPLPTSAFRKFTLANERPLVALRHSVLTTVFDPSAACELLQKRDGTRTSAERQVHPRSGSGGRRLQIPANSHDVHRIRAWCRTAGSRLGCGCQCAKVHWRHLVHRDDLVDLPRGGTGAGFLRSPATD